MAFPETSDLGRNVRNNNNIVWKNVSVVNLLPDMTSIHTSVLLAGAKLLKMSYSKTDIAFVVPEEKGNNNILGVANVEIDLGEFGEAWLKNGGKVEGGRPYQDNYGRTLVRVTESKGKIYGVPIGSTQMGSITVIVTPTQFSPDLTYLFDVQQMNRNTVIGGERFDIQYTKERIQTGKTAAPATASKQATTTPTATAQDNSGQQLKVFQVGKQLNIQMNDSKEYVVTIANGFGMVMTTTKMVNQKAIPVSNYGQGIYFIKLVNAKEQKTYTASVMIQ
jgi:hypothetical protein